MIMRLKTFFAAVVLLLASVSAWGQAKVYTKRMVIADFPTKTTKVVLAGESFLEMAVRDEVAARWRISPYEFCSVEDYERLKTDSGFYFLRLVSKDGIAFLELTKGGKPDAEDRLKRPADVVSIPISASEAMSGDEIVYLGAFLDIVQSYTEEAIISDRVGYSGLGIFNARSLKGRRLFLDPEAARDKYQVCEENAVVGISVVPLTIGLKSRCYRMLIAADTHELLYYSEHRYKGPNDAEFSDKEVKTFGNRDADIVR